MSGIVNRRVVNAIIVKKLKRREIYKLSLGGSSALMAMPVFAGLFDSYYWRYGADPLLVLIFLALLGFAGIMGASALKNRKIRIRFTNYISLLESRPGMTIEELSVSVGVPESTVRKDFQHLLDRGYLSGGHFTIDGRRFVLPNSEYVKANGITQRIADAIFGDTSDDDEYETMTEEQAASYYEKNATMPKAGTEQRYEKHERDESGELLKRIKAVGGRIRDESVAQNTARIEQISVQIIQAAAERPNGKSQISTFMGYYLPTTLKILEAYARYEDQKIVGQNVQTASANIKSILDKLVDGFVKQLDKLYEGEMLDIGAEIEALESMLAKDGLSASDMSMPSM